MIVLDSEGHERYRFAGYLPTDEFLAQLCIALGKVQFANKHWGEAQRWFQRIVDEFPNTDVAPEALYWEGVSRYKASNDHHILAGTAEQFTRRYQNTSWAKRSSVWLPKAA